MCATFRFIPYCTSDVWSGSKTTKPKEKGKDTGKCANLERKGHNVPNNECAHDSTEL